MMATATRATVVGVFSSRDQAKCAFDGLRRAGFRDDQLGVMARDQDVKDDITGRDVSNVAVGAATGVVAGASVGALWGLGIAAGLLPAIGPVIAGGTLAGILASAATGAAVAGIAGALIGLGVSEEEAHHYEKEVHAGRILITVKADGRYDEAFNILRDCGASFAQPQMAATR